VAGPAFGACSEASKTLCTKQNGKQKLKTAIMALK